MHASRTRHDERGPGEGPRGRRGQGEGGATVERIYLRRLTHAPAPVTTVVEGELVEEISGGPRVGITVTPLTARSILSRVGETCGVSV